MRKWIPHLAIYPLGVNYSREVSLSLVPVYQRVPAFLKVGQRPGGPLHHDVLLDAEPNQPLDELVPLKDVPVALEDVLFCALDGLLAECMTIAMAEGVKCHFLVLRGLRVECRGSHP